MKGSGKQVLSKILSDLSTTLLSDDELPQATRKLMAGMLVHGSTSADSYDLVSKMGWSSSTRDGEVWRQGVATKEGNVFISDLFESMIELPSVKEAMLREYPDLTPKNYEACINAIWLIISSVQMFSELLPVETKEDLDIDGWVKLRMRHYDSFFEELGE